MKRFYAGTIGNLVAAAEAARHNRGALFTIAYGGKQPLLADLLRQIVMLLLVTERTCHPAAAGIKLLDGYSRHAAEKLLHRGSTEQRLLVAMAVNNNLTERRTEFAVEPALL